MEVIPARACSEGVLVATPTDPTKSMAESVLPGLNPYQPNQRINRRDRDGQVVWQHGSAVALNLRPRRGPEQLHRPKAINPPIVWTTVEPAKSWKPIPEAGQK